MKGHPMTLLAILGAILVVLIIYSIYRWRSGVRLEAAFRARSRRPVVADMAPDVLRSMRRHPSYRSKREA
jgi:hypothetical protein